MVTTFLLAVAIHAQAYFPEGSLGQTQAQHKFVTEWYSKHLVAMGEKPLLNSASAQMFRFLWLRTFHHPVCITVAVRGDGTGLLTTKETNGQGGYDPGRLIQNRQRKLSKDELTPLLKLASAIPFNQRDSTVGLDGAQWIVESTKANGYRLADVFSPTSEHPVHAFGSLLIRLSGLQIPTDEMY